LLDRGLGEPTGYGLGKSGWVTIQLQRGDEASFEELCAWVEESWRAVAPKKLVKARDVQRAAASSIRTPPRRSSSRLSPPNSPRNRRSKT
jgi:hypothetical protein